MTSDKPDRRIFGLDIVRATAVSFVVFGHFLQHAKFSPYIVHFGRLGILGVEIFFVLSGFLIGGIIIDSIRAGRFSEFSHLRSFWTRRWLRTLPLYYLFFAIFLRFDWIGPQRFRDHLEFLAFLQNFAWKAPDFFLVSWSLTIEEFFYLLFPLALFLAIKATRSPLRALAISIGFFLTVPLLLRAAQAPYPDWMGFNEQIRMLMIKRLDALMYGVGAVVLKTYFPESWIKIRKWTPLWAAYFLGVCAYIYCDNYGLWGHPWSGPVQVFYFPVLSLSVALLLPAFDGLRSGEGYAAGFVTFVSTVSYSIYLGHMIVITWVGRALEASPRIAAVVGNGVLLYLCFSVCILAAASVTYYGWEKPFMRLRDRPFLRPREAKPSAAGAAAAV